MGLNDSAALLWKMGLNDSEFTEKLSKSATLVGHFASKMNAAFNVVAGGVVLGFLQKVVDRAGGIKDTADALEVTTDSLQAMDYVAKQAGVSAETLHNAYGILKGKASEAAEGNKQVVAALEKLGISAAEFVKLPVDRQLEMIAKGAANAGDKTEAFGAVADLIGQKNAPRLNVVLQELAAQGLDGVTESAKKMGQVMSEDTITTLDGLGDRIDTVKNAAINAAGTVFNFFLKAGEGLGAIAGNVVNWAQGMETGYLTTEKAQKKFAATVETTHLALKGTKATTDDIAKAHETQAKAKEAAQVSEMDALKKIEFFTDKLGKLEIERGKFSEKTKESLKLQTEIVETQVKLGEVIKKQKEEEAKKSEELAKKSQLSRDESLEFVRLEMKGLANLSGVEKLRYDQLKLITEQKRVQVEIDEMLAIPAEKRTKEENEWLKLCIKQSDKLRDQIEEKNKLIKAAGLQVKAEEATVEQIKEQIVEKIKLVEASILLKKANGENTEELERQLNVLKGLVAEATKLDGILSRTGNPDNVRLNDRQLTEKIVNLKRAIADNFATDRLRGYDSFVTAVAKMDLEKAQAESDLRKQFRQRVSVFGEDRALQFSSAFDEERLKGYIKQADDTKRVADGIEELNQRLNQKFPKGGFPR